MTSCYYLFDNRRPQYQSFEMEASLASYLLHSSTLFQKHLALNRKFSSWMEPPAAVLSAATVDKTRLHAANFFDQALNDLTEGKYVHAPANSISQYVTTWEHFFVHGISMMQQHAKRFHKPSDPIFLAIFTTDSAIVPIYTVEHEIRSAVRKFGQAVAEMKANMSLHVRIICTRTLRKESADGAETLSGISNLHLILREFGNFITLVQTSNSSLHFEEELLEIVSKQTPSLICELDLPAAAEVRCSILYEIFPCTMQTASELHDGLKMMVIFGMCPRSGIDPAYIEGATMQCRPCRRSNGKFLDDANYLQNQLAFHSLCGHLAKYDLLMVLRAQKGELDEYWALIPPAEVPTCFLQSQSIFELVGEEPREKSSYLLLIRLSDRESQFAMPPDLQIAVDPDMKEDVLALQPEMDEFMMQSLQSLGDPAPYSVHACHSGRFNMLLRDAASGRHSNSNMIKSQNNATNTKPGNASGKAHGNISTGSSTSSRAAQAHRLASSSTAPLPKLQIQVHRKASERDGNGKPFREPSITAKGIPHPAHDSTLPKKRKQESGQGQGSRRGKSQVASKHAGVPGKNVASKKSHSGVGTEKKAAFVDLVYHDSDSIEDVDMCEDDDAFEDLHGNFKL